MSRIKDEFFETLPLKIKEHCDDLLLLRESLIEFRDKGMDKDSMLEGLESLRKISDPKTEDILLELMDFVVGFCSPQLSIF